MVEPSERSSSGRVASTVKDLSPGMVLSTEPCEDSLGPADRSKMSDTVCNRCRDGEARRFLGVKLAGSVLPGSSGFRRCELRNDPGLPTLVHFKGLW